MTTITWCIETLEKHDKFSLDYAHCQLILDLICVQKSQKEHITTIFTQEKDKVSEIKVETPFERRQREFAGDSYMAEEKKDKSSDEIAAE